MPFFLTNSEEKERLFIYNNCPYFAPYLSAVAYETHKSKITSKKFDNFKFKVEKMIYNREPIEDINDVFEEKKIRTKLFKHYIIRL